jgi:hypothetical protein
MRHLRVYDRTEKAQADAQLHNIEQHPETIRTADRSTPNERHHTSSRSRRVLPRLRRIHRTPPRRHPQTPRLRSPPRQRLPPIPATTRHRPRNPRRDHRILRQRHRHDLQIDDNPGSGQGGLTVSDDLTWTPDSDDDPEPEPTTEPRHPISDGGPQLINPLTGSPYAVNP